MTNINNQWIKAGGLIAALAVALGAFDMQPSGSNQIVSEADFSKAVTYQLMHGLAIVIVGTLILFRPVKLLKASAVCFLLGTVMFSGSTYLLMLTGVFWLAYLKLIGVVCLVAGWILLVEGACPGWNKSKACSDGCNEEQLHKSAVPSPKLDRKDTPGKRRFAGAYRRV